MSIIIRKRLNIVIEIEVFSLIIFLIFNMPYPVNLLWSRISLSFPKIFTPKTILYFISFYPISRNIFFITAADSTTFGLTYFISDPKLTFPVQINPDHSEVFGLDERMQKLMCFLIDLIQSWFFLYRIEVDKCSNHY